MYDMEVWTKIYEEWTVNTFIQETSIDDKQVKVKYESLDRPLIAINVRYGSIYKSLTENGILDNAVKITKDSYPDLYESIDSVYNHGNTVIIYGTTHSTDIKDKYGMVIKFKDEYWLKNI
jgi:glucose dehydrogenase